MVDRALHWGSLAPLVAIILLFHCTGEIHSQRWSMLAAESLALLAAIKGAVHCETLAIV